jgi:hypothetical protein
MTVKVGRPFSGPIARVWFLVLGMTLASPLQSMGKAADGPPAEQLEIEAAFVLNFIRLVAWVEVPGENGLDLPVCALSKSDFSDRVRHAVSGKTVGNRSISFRLNPNPDSPHCRVLILDASDYAAGRAALKAVRNAPVLTIGNGEGLLPLGGMFELVVQDRKVQFDANLDAVRQAKLEVSARLLQLSRNLRKGTNGGS